MCFTNRIKEKSATKLIWIQIQIQMYSMEKLCLDIIVQNFEIFFCAFTQSKDEYVQRHFQFLQRRFSVQLATALCIKEKLKEDYFQLLINEHLNLLIGTWFKNSRCLNSMESVFCRLPNLTRICFKNCGDEILENVAKFCPKIVEIDVRYSNVTDNGVKYLYENKNGIVPCPGLKNLFIKSTLVTDKGAECLIRNLPSLEIFDYPNVPLLLFSIHKENYPLIKKIRMEKMLTHSLIHLDLSELLKLFCYSDVLKTCLCVCPKLESIACYISDKQDLSLFTASRFKKLHLEFLIREPKIYLDNFLKINGWNLTSLKISNPPNILGTTCHISVSVLTEYCPILEELYFHNVTLTNDIDDCLPVTFPFLTKCCFSHIEPSNLETACRILSSSPKLQSVSFRYMLMLPDELKSAILMWCKNPTGKLIEFAYIYLETEFFKDIVLNSFNIKAVFLYQCYFDDLEMNNFFQNIPKEPSIKPRIFVKKYNPWISDMGELRDMNFINHNSIFNDGRLNLENYLKEEYRCSNICDYVFTETVFNKKYSYSEDNWEDNWDIITS